MKRISELNLLGERLKELSGQTPVRPFERLQLINKVFRKNSPRQDQVVLRIEMEWYQYVRAEAFIDDLMEVAGTDLPFDVAKLICLLYNDFLRGVRQGVDLFDLNKRLAEKKSWVARTRLEEELVQVEKHRWTVMEREVKLNKRMIEFGLILSKKSALRGEILLYDLAIAAGGKDALVSLEDLLAILLLDFMAEVHKGNQISVMRKLLCSLL